MISFEYVEDIPKSLTYLKFTDRDFVDLIFKDQWTDKFITSVSDWVDNKALTTQQATTLLKIFGKCKFLLVKKQILTTEQVDNILARPIYRKPPAQSIFFKREVRYAGSNILVFRFKRNDEIAKALKNLNKKHPSDVGIDENGMMEDVTWDWVSKVWTVKLTSSNLEKTMQIISDYNFDFDEDILQYLTLSANSKDVPANFTIKDGKIIANVCSNDLMAHLIQYSMNGELA